MTVEGTPLNTFLANPLKKSSAMFYVEILFVHKLMFLLDLLVYFVYNNLKYFKTCFDLA